MNISKKYPQQSKKTHPYIIYFLSPYLVEAYVYPSIIKYRNRFDIEKIGHLQLLLTSIEPDLNIKLRVHILISLMFICYKVKKKYHG